MRNRSYLPSFFDAAPESRLTNLTGEAHPLEVLDVTYLHFHSLLELGVCVSGRGTCVVEETEYPFEAGDVQIIFPFQRHLSRSEGNEKSLWYWLSINPLQLLAGWNAPDLPRLERLLYTGMGLCGIIDRNRYPLIAQLIRRITLPGETQVRLSCLHALIELLSDESRTLPHLELRPERAFVRLEPALRCVQDTLREGHAPEVEDLCRACRMSPAAVRRQFHQVLGQSPCEYIQTCQMRRAQQLLLLTDEPITQIALSVGYQDVSGFNRQFLRHCGMPPRAWRAGNRPLSGARLPFASADTPGMLG